MEWVVWVEWEEWVVWECKPNSLQIEFRGHLMMAFFLTKKMICQNDTVENLSKTQVLRKNQNLT